MIQTLSPWTRRLGVALALLAVLLLVFGGGLHLGDHCHEAGHEQECAFAVLLLTAVLLVAAAWSASLPSAAPPVPVRARGRRRPVDVRVPGARAPPSRN